MAGRQTAGQLAMANADLYLAEMIWPGGQARTMTLGHALGPDPGPSPGPDPGPSPGPDPGPSPGQDPGPGPGQTRADRFLDVLATKGFWMRFYGKIPC